MGTQPIPASNAKTPLPPGMVLGPDGKPCKICTAFRNWKPAASKGSTPAQAAGAASIAALAAQRDKHTRPEYCPPDVEQLGRATWTFLHTTAAYYPDKPTVYQRAQMLSLLRALPTLYPCSHCATHLGQEMKTSPPDVSGRVALSRWLCQQHNLVNERLGKDQFDCAKTDERWKDGPSDGSCD
ncbi:hypothetical protein EW146_g8289 [Bondarzewia mesenterica]|uniref:Sulfhydryl oxidase n=1 Tax=Bondarzewia mesenterica TaxID=1095465 RepID=A0A4S4LHF8_9AGAM|nr:hypothetical protein EW146_g8289 [Bondarzewia mesenterica]